MIILTLDRNEDHSWSSLIGLPDVSFLFLTKHMWTVNVHYSKKVKEKKVIISNSDAMEFNDVFKTQTVRLEGAIWFAILLCLSILSRLKLISWVEDSRQN